MTLSYVLQSGPAKNLSIALRHAQLRTEFASQRDADEHRIIVSYPINIF
ncbi:hypothetical protein ALP29_200448 [Pseudomonas syringae pv. avii]|uniref:Porin n=1 Tax=Pseudomonas syringae pv. avii TaxID=663959 RepID=A0A3M5UZN9_PSESX|nr:hypothetical protein ALP29_200448 [Pseudomonas syringae pv. avii]